jgi:dTDP-glucose 4,6-dehydratase
MFVKHDVTNYIYVDGPVDLVLHWASPASPIDYLELPIPTLKVGALGTHKALGLAKAKNARFVIASTSEVYGESAGASAEGNLLGQRQPGRARAASTTSQALRRGDDDGLPPLSRGGHKIVRIFNTYGPRMRLQRRPRGAGLHEPGARGEDVTIFGSGKQTRSFCYVTDLVDGILRLAESKENDPVNIGNPHEMTIEDIARTIIRMSGSQSKIVYRPLPEDDPKVRQPGHHARAHAPRLGAEGRTRRGPDERP